MVSIGYGNILPAAQALLGSQHQFSHIHAGTGSHRDLLCQIALASARRSYSPPASSPLNSKSPRKSVSVTAIFWPALDRSVTFAPLTHSPDLPAGSISPAIKGRGRPKYRITAPPDAVAKHRLRLRDFKSFPEQHKSLSVNSGFCSANLQSSCRAGLQTRTHPIWRLGSRQYSRSGDRLYNLRISSKSINPIIGVLL